MPSVISHYLLAKRILEDTNCFRDISINEQAFILGNLGPDFLYACKDVNGVSLAKIGYLLHHEDACRTLTVITEKARTIGNDIATSYMFGFLSHYAFDSTAHPFVLATVKDMLPDCRRATESTLHDKIETNLDIILLRNRTGQLPAEVKFYKFMNTDNKVLDIIGELLSTVIEVLFKQKLDKSAIVNGYRKDYKKFLKSIYDATGMKRSFYQRIEKASDHAPVRSSRIRSVMEDDDYDYANTSKHEWTYNGIKSDEDYFELFDRSFNLAQRLISAAINKEPYDSITNGRGFI